MYAVMNSDGLFFRAKGRSGYGKSWVEKLEEARIYAKIGYARAQITTLGKQFPEYPVPTLIVLKVTDYEQIDETERVETIIKNSKYQLERAKKKLKEAQLKACKEELKVIQEKIKRLEE